MKNYEPIFTNDNIPNGEDALKLMFSESQKGNTVCIPSFHGEAAEDSNFILCNLDWTKEDLEKTICIYKKLVDDIKEISKYYNYFEEIFEDKTFILTDSLEKTYNKYLKPYIFDEKTEEKKRKIYEKVDKLGMKRLSKRELEFMENLFKKTEENAKVRLGKRNCAFEVLYCANRVLKVFFLNPPQFIIDKELSYFAQALAINKFSSECFEYEKSKK